MVNADLDDNCADEKVSKMNDTLSLVVQNWIMARERDVRVSELVSKYIVPRGYYAQHSLDFASVFSLVAQSYNIESCLISHGSHVLNQDNTAKREWAIHARTMCVGPFTKTLIQTPAELAFLEDIGTESTKTLCYPHMFDHTEQTDRSSRHELFGEHAEQFILLHASTPKPLNCLRPLIYETIDEYVKNTKNLLNALSVREDIFIAVRFRPIPGLSEAEFRAQMPKHPNWQIYSNGVFGDLLAQADALISYSSTSIEEAFFNGKPVLLWPGQNAYKHINACMIPGLSNSDFSAVLYCDESNIYDNILKIWSQQKPMSNLCAKSGVQKIYQDFAYSLKA